MNKEAKKIIPLLWAALVLLSSGCGDHSPSLSFSEQLALETLTEAVSTEEVTAAVTEHITTTQSTSATAQTTERPTQEPTEELLSERQIVEAIYTEVGGELTSPYWILGEDDQMIQYENDADYLMHMAETFSESCLGSISGEEDLIEKARTVWIEKLGAAYIDYVESEYVEEDGVKIKLERRYPPYRIKYFEEYDVWYIVTNPPSGIREDGVSIDVIWDLPPYLLIRGEDGMILGAWL